MAYPKRTSRQPVIVDGVTFLCWQTGIGSYQLKSEDDRVTVGSSYYRSTYWVVVDGKNLNKRFRSERTALRAAVNAMSA